MQIYPIHNNTNNYLSIRFQQILFWGFVYTIIGGVLRKWVFLGGTISNVLLFGQLLLPLVLAWQYSKINVKNDNLYKHVLVIYVLILAMMACNPLNHTIFHGIIGFIIHLGFWYLLLAYLNVANWVNVKQLDNFLFLILVIETVLASMQYSLPANHILNRYVREMDAIANIGENIRVTGTFSYLGGFGSLCGFYSFFCWYLINTNKKPLLVVTAIVLTLWCAMMNGGRSPVFTTIILFAIALYENREKIRRYVKYFALITFSIAVLLFFYNPFGSVWDNWKDRTEQLAERSEQSHRIYRMFFIQFMYHGEQPVFGAGLGSSYQGTNQMFGTSEIWQKYGYMEEEAERIVFEGGYLLYLIRIGLFIVVLSALNIKRLSKIALFILYVNAFITFNTYNTFFLAMGLIWINYRENKEFNYGQDKDYSFKFESNAHT
jgi:hypothetical protein